jgi:hypothetical protein
MENEKTSPPNSNLGTPNKVLVYVTRETILRILLRYLDEVKCGNDLSPFIDRVMADLAKEDQTVNSGAFDHIFGRGNLFGRSFGK